MDDDDENEENVAWAEALLKESATKTMVRIFMSDITSTEVCSMLEAFLESSPKLERALFFGRNTGIDDTEREYDAETMDRLLSAAQKNTAIQYIGIDESEFRTATILNLLHKKRESLNTLSLSNSCYSHSQSSYDAMAHAIKKCHSLEDVLLDALPEPFYVAILKNGLSNHPALQYLLLSEQGTWAWDESVSMAVQHFLHSSGPKLKSIKFSGVSFTHLTMEPIVNGLLHYPTIELLAMQHCRFSDPGALQALRSLLQSNNKFCSLDLNYTRFNSDMLREILSALHKNKSLRRLNMMNCGLEDATLITHVQTLLHHNKTVSHLNLGSNAFGASGAALLAHAIQNLTEFDCPDCRFGDAGIRALLPLPTVEDSHWKLRELRLDGNQITHQGIRHLLEVLQHSSCQISILSLCDNPINDNGSRVLADMLRTNRKLVELSLDCCDLTLSGLQIILSSLQSNQVLEFLSLGKITSNSRSARDNDGNENNYNFLTVYNMLSEFVPKCQLKKLDLDIDSGYVDDSSGLEFDREDVYHGQDMLLHAFEDNTTIEEVNVSNKFFHPERQNQLAYYMLRNKFQVFLQVGHAYVAKNSATDFQDNLTGMEVDDDPHFSTVSTVPRGIWAHVFEAAHKHHYNASVLYHLLSSRPDLIAGEHEKK